MNVGAPKDKNEACKTPKNDLRRPSVPRRMGGSSMKSGKRLVGKGKGRVIIVIVARETKRYKSVKMTLTRLNLSSRNLIRPQNQ